MSSDTLQLIALIIVIAAGAIWIAIGGRRADRTRLQRLSKREDLNFDLFYEERYRELGFDPERVLEALNDVARAIDVPVTKIRPTDRFDVELAAERGWEFDDGVAVLSDRAERKRFRREKGTTQRSKIETVDDYIRAIAVENRSS